MGQTQVRVIKITRLVLFLLNLLLFINGALNAPDSTKWTNILAVLELLFCLPVSNGHLERVFSQLKLIKGERRTSLGEDQLDQLIRINVEAPALSQWDASNAVELWLHDRTRRLNIRDTRTRPSSSSSPGQIADSDSQEDPPFTLSLESWESWLDPSESDSD